MCGYVLLAFAFSLLHTIFFAFAEQCVVVCGIPFVMRGGRPTLSHNRLDLLARGTGPEGVCVLPYRRLHRALCASSLSFLS